MSETHPSPASDIPWERLAAPARRALNGAGFSTLQELAEAGESRIKALHGIGPNALKQLREAMTDKGLTFAP